MARAFDASRERHARAALAALPKEKSFTVRLTWRHQEAQTYLCRTLGMSKADVIRLALLELEAKNKRR
ncbi:hypothetical protein SODG_004173 [Sodalis praecaptivus]